MLFYIFIMCTIGLMIPMVLGVYHNVNHYKKHMPPGYEWPAIKDFWIMVVSSFVFAFLEMVCKKYLYVLFIPICKV